VPDHLAAMLATVPAVMSAADATTRLRVGTNVLNNDLRHPVLVAREAATLDLLTDVRLELGLGAGYMRIEYDQAGLGFDRAASGSSGSPSRWRSSRACSAAPRSPSPATTTT
jgi:alkanesulfonate monooxygenase SsuD/methylene tetrahydromethanopterin reductase-like flavin-dependent oxidoreductase (luciferase family)